jgi:hypothetical protein
MPTYEAAKLLHSAKFIDTAGRERYLEMWLGDIVSSQFGAPIDLLVISAFPNDYSAVPGSVIRRLGELGLHVAAAAADKVRDFRTNWHCWVGRPHPESSPVRQVVCFEPEVEGRAEDRVGNVFRTLREHLLSEGYSGESPIEVLRLPLLATGSRQASKQAMLAAIISQASIHLGAGLPVRRIQLFLGFRDTALDSLLIEAGIQLEQARTRWLQDFASLPTPDRDLFISYRHVDEPILRPLLDELRRRKPGISLFIDQEELEPGSYWKQDLIRGLGSCRHSLCFVTDGYANSVECMDEFHAGMIWNHRRPGFLLPVLNLQSRKISDLPETIQRVHCLLANLPKEPASKIASQVIGQMGSSSGE